MSGHYRDQLADQPIGLLRHRDRDALGRLPAAQASRVRHRRLDDAGEVGPITREYVDTGEVAVIIPVRPEGRRDRRDPAVPDRRRRWSSTFRPRWSCRPASSTRARTSRSPRGANWKRRPGLAPSPSSAAIAFSPRRASPPSTSPCSSPSSTPPISATSAGKDDEDEDIRPILAPVNELTEAIDEGRAENAFLVTAVHWFARKGRARAQALLGTLDRED